MITQVILKDLIFYSVTPILNTNQLQRPSKINLSVTAIFLRKRGNIESESSIKILF